MFSPDRSFYRSSRGQSPLIRRSTRRPLPARYARRRGVAFVYTALGLAVALMVSALVIDVGLLYQRKASMQNAADSAALAGAHALANFKTPYQAYLAAGAMAERPENGGFTKVNSLPGSFNSQYVANVGKSKFTVTYPAVDEKGVQRNNWFKVTLNRSEPALFGGMWPLNKASYDVGASAIAIYDTLAPLSIKGTGVYGVAPGPVNLSVFGPDGRYSYGDAYSTKKLNDGTTNNPNYNSKGYDFQVNIPETIKKANVEIFDPDCYNGNGSINASATDIDELRTRTGNGTTANATTTAYSLFFDNGTADTADDIQVGNTLSYGGNGDSTNMQWVESFKFDRSLAIYQGGNFRLNVRSTAGSSENGFDLRAGPQLKANQSWNPNNGTSINAMGHLPINFNVDGKVRMTLGKVPPQAGGSDLIIRNFDTDVNSKSVTYFCDKIVGPYKGGWKGTLSDDGKFSTDTIKIPDAYRNLAEAGTWSAEYTAGNQDTSVWDMSYTGIGDGKPGRIKLIR